MNYLTESGLYHLLRILKNWIQDKIINNLTNQISNLSRIENQHYVELSNKKIDYYKDLQHPMPFGLCGIKSDTVYANSISIDVSEVATTYVILYEVKTDYTYDKIYYQGSVSKLYNEIHNGSSLYIGNIYVSRYANKITFTSYSSWYKIRIIKYERLSKISDIFLPSFIDWEETDNTKSTYINNKPFGKISIKTNKTGEYPITGNIVKVYENGSYYELELQIGAVTNVSSVQNRPILVNLSDIDTLKITNNTELNTIKIEIPNTKQIEEKYIPDTIARTTDINYDFYKQLTSEFNKSGYTSIQYKKAQVFSYEPFIISATGETIIPYNFLNDDGTDFFVDYYWKYAFIAGGIPIKTISWDDSGKPSKLSPIYDSSQTYTIDFTNKKIIKD